MAGGIFNNRLLFSLLFSGSFCGGQDCNGVGLCPPPLVRENPGDLSSVLALY